MPKPTAEWRGTVATAEAMHALGRQLGAGLFEGAVVLLEGGLGAGKTTFAQGIGAALGVGGRVTSPTYAIIHEYPECTPALRHCDLYRIESEQELLALALDERAGIDGAWIVEWGSRFMHVWPSERLVVALAIFGNARQVQVSAFGRAHAALISALTAG